MKSKKNTSSGRDYEKAMQSISEELCDLPTVTHADKIKDTKKYNTISHLETNSPYPSIKSSKGRMGKQEFVLHFAPGVFQKENIFLREKDGSVHVRIDCKMQKVSGSTDEKLLFPLENAREKRFPEKNFVLLHGGGGASKGMLKYVKEKGLEIKHINFRVMALGEFLSVVSGVAGTGSHEVQL